MILWFIKYNTIQHNIKTIISFTKELIYGALFGSKYVRGMKIKQISNGIWCRLVMQ